MPYHLPGVIINKQMNFLELNFKCDRDFTEILIAELASIGYESFMETDEGFNAYIEKSSFSEKELTGILDKYHKITLLSYFSQDLKEKNWNEEWEKNYEPIIVEDKIIVKASFHKINRSYPVEIIINPRMSFGTGHHDTTYLMLQFQLETDQKDKDVLDVGCGTGILSIMACKMSANSVVAIDNNDWAVENSKDNFQINQCENVKLISGTIIDIPAQDQYDIIMANINRNILLEESSLYIPHLKDDSFLIMSGFFTEDIKYLEEKLNGLGWKLVNQKHKNNWAAIKFERK